MSGTGASPRWCVDVSRLIYEPARLCAGVIGVSLKACDSYVHIRRFPPPTLTCVTEIIDSDWITTVTSRTHTHTQAHTSHSLKGTHNLRSTRAWEEITHRCWLSHTHTHTATYTNKHTSPRVGSTWAKLPSKRRASFKRKRSVNAPFHPLFVGFYKLVRDSLKLWLLIPAPLPVFWLSRQIR